MTPKIMPPRHHAIEMGRDGKIELFGADNQDLKCRNHTQSGIVTDVSLFDEM